MKKVGIPHLFFGTPQNVDYSFNNCSCTRFDPRRVVALVVSKLLAKDGLKCGTIANNSASDDWFSTGVNWLGFTTALGLKIQL